MINHCNMPQSQQDNDLHFWPLSLNWLIQCMQN